MMLKKEESEVIRQLKQEVQRLGMLEKQLEKMRNDCEQKSKIWETVKQEIEALEEKAVIYRYKIVNTQLDTE